MLIVLITAACLAALSIALRFIIKAFLEPVGTALTIDGFAQLRYRTNTGAAFGIFNDHTAVISVFTLLLLLLLLYFVYRNFFRTVPEKIFSGMIIGGGIANLIERLCFGYVVDYVEFLFVDFAVFNFADICITTGAVLLAFWMIFISKSIYSLDDKANKKSKKTSGGDDNGKL